MISLPGSGAESDPGRGEHSAHHVRDRDKEMTYEVYFRCSKCGKEFDVLSCNEFLDRARCPAGHRFTVRMFAWPARRPEERGYRAYDYWGE